jgi:hypothetical protein
LLPQPAIHRRSQLQKQYEKSTQNPNNNRLRLGLVCNRSYVAEKGAKTMPEVKPINTSLLRQGAAEKPSVRLPSQTALAIANELDALRARVKELEEENTELKLALSGDIPKIHIPGKLLYRLVRGGD